MPRGPAREKPRRECSDVSLSPCLLLVRCPGLRQCHALRALSQDDLLPVWVLSNLWPSAMLVHNCISIPTPEISFTDMSGNVKFLFTSFLLRVLLLKRWGVRRGRGPFCSPRTTIPSQCSPPPEAQGEQKTREPCVPGSLLLHLLLTPGVIATCALSFSYV